MTPEFETLLLFVGAIVTLACLILTYRAIRTAARELTTIRQHLDRLTPEALLALKTARRGGAEPSSQ